MPLSPLDIHNKEFARGFRGYAEDEVNEFLDQIMRDYEIILREKKELEEKVKAMTDQMGRTEPHSVVLTGGGVSMKMVHVVHLGWSINYWKKM